MCLIALIIVTTIVSMVPLNAKALMDSTSNAMYETVTTAIINRIVSDELPTGTQLLPMNLFSPFLSYLEVSLLVGIVLTSPVMFYELYAFINPALYENERKYLWLSVLSFTALFLLGDAFGYYYLTPITYRFFINGYRILGLSPMYEFGDFMSLTVEMVLLTGIVFTVPVFFLLLVQFRLLSTDIVTKHRKIVYVAIFIVISLLPNDPSPIDTILLFVPTMILIEISVFIGKRIEKNRK